MRYAVLALLLLVRPANAETPRPAPTDAARRCTLGLEAAARRAPRPIDLTRADLYLPACATAGDPSLRSRGAAAHAAVTRALRASDLSPVEVDARPPGLRVQIDTLPGDSFTAPARVWLPGGRHRFTGSRADGATTAAEVTVADGNRAMVVLELPRSRDGAAAGVVDFGDEAAAEVHAGAPAAVRHESLLPERYRRGLKAPRRPARRR